MYQIAAESKFTYSKKATPKPNTPAHDGVTKYHYFITNLVYKDNDGKYTSCHMNIDVKRNPDGDWFYSFAIEKGSVPQTLLAAGTENSATLPTNKVADTAPIVNKKYSNREIEKLDRDYMDAVNRGDMRAAQKMVDDAAKQWGAFLNNTDANEVFKLEDRIDEEISDIKHYAKLAAEVKEEYPGLSNVLYNISVQEDTHQAALHAEVVKLIENHRKTHGEPPAAMMAVYEFLHKRSIDKLADARRYQEIFKGI